MRAGRLLPVSGLTSLRAWRLGSLLAVLSVLVLLGSDQWQPRFYARLHDTVQDARWRWQADPRPVSNPVLVDISDDAIAHIGPWPWPRELLAHLIRRLRDSGAQVVVLDMVFPDLHDTGDAALRDELVRPGVVTGMHPRLGHASSLRPLACAGHVVPETEADGLVRRLRLHLGTLPALALAALDCAPALREPGRQALARWQALQAKAPAVTGQAFSLPWRHAADRFTTLPADRLLAAQTLPDLRGKVVVVGASAVGLADRIASPLESPVAGMLTHATLLADALNPPPALPDRRALAWAWALLSVALLGALLLLERPRTTLAVWLALLLGWLAVLALTPADQPQLPALPLLGLACFLLVQAPAEWVFAQAQASQLGRRMRRYLPPAVLAEVLRLSRAGQDPTQPRRAEITVLFADVAGYTALAEYLSPERLALLTQALLELMTAAVQRSDGTLDKYMGDAVMAFWGAPLAQADQAARACDAALDMQRQLADWNRVQRPLQFPELDTVRLCIGIHSGPAVVGELGSSFRQTYTAIGDTVNVAQRLQVEAGQHREVALISAATRQQVPASRLAPLGSVQVKGRQEPLDVFALRD